MEATFPFWMWEERIASHPLFITAIMNTTFNLLLYTAINLLDHLFERGTGKNLSNIFSMCKSWFKVVFHISETFFFPQYILSLFLLLLLNHSCCLKLSIVLIHKCTGFQLSLDIEMAKLCVYNVWFRFRFFSFLNGE